MSYQRVMANRPKQAPAGAHPRSKIGAVAPIRYCANGIESTQAGNVMETIFARILVWYPPGGSFQCSATLALGAPEMLAANKGVIS